MFSTSYVFKKTSATAHPRLLNRDAVFVSRRLKDARFLFQFWRFASAIDTHEQRPVERILLDNYFMDSFSDSPTQGTRNIGMRLIRLGMSPRAVNFNGLD